MSPSSRSTSDLYAAWAACHHPSSRGCAKESGVACSRSPPPERRQTSAQSSTASSAESAAACRGVATDRARRSSCWPAVGASWAGIEGVVSGPQRRGMACGAGHPKSLTQLLMEDHKWSVTGSEWRGGRGGGHCPARHAAPGSSKNRPGACWEPLFAFVKRCSHSKDERQRQGAGQGAGRGPRWGPGDAPRRQG